MPPSRPPIRARSRTTAAVESTAGWVTGVLFEGWRSSDHVAGQGGETDPLYDYLSSQILGQLSEKLNYDRLYQDALSDPELKRTRLEVEALAQLD